jgi:hypothetical protein
MFRRFKPKDIAREFAPLLDGLFPHKSREARASLLELFDLRVHLFSQPEREPYRSVLSALD